jgi:capsular polysaccharide biosynthesis protein
MTDELHPGAIASMWRFRWTSAAIVVFVVAASATVGLIVQPRAKAEATISLATPPANSVLFPGTQGDASLARYTAQRAAFVKSDAMLTDIAAHLAGKRRSITSLRHDLSASPSSTSNAITVVAEGDTDVKAVQLAAATVNAYQTETAKEVKDLTGAAVRSIENSSTLVQAEAGAGSDAVKSSVANTVSSLAIQASAIRTSSALFGDGVEFVIAPRADAVTKPALPIREIALGLVLGLVIAATVAWIRVDYEIDSDSDTSK